MKLTLKKIALCTAVAAVGLTFTACSGGGGGGDSAAAGDASSGGLAPASIEGRAVTLRWNQSGVSNRQWSTLTMLGSGTATRVDNSGSETVPCTYSPHGDTASISFTETGNGESSVYSFELRFTDSQKGSITGGKVVTRSGGVAVESSVTGGSFQFNN